MKKHPIPLHYKLSFWYVSHLFKDVLCIPIICHHQGVNHYFEDKRRAYLQCQQCELVFVKPEQRLEQKKKHYDLHENDPSDAGYRRFLSRIADLTNKISSNSQGLDFGCGPGLRYLLC